MAAISQLPLPIADSPLDLATPGDDQKDQPEFAISCQLASCLTGREEPGGKLLQFTTEEGQVSAMVENHAVANVSMLFHDQKEVCESRHEHKVGVNAEEAAKNPRKALAEMKKLSQDLPTSEGRTKLKNAAVHALLDAANSAPSSQLPISCS